MILLSRSRRRALHVPVLYFVIALFLGALDALLLREKGPAGGSIALGLFALAMLGLAVYTTRVVRREADEIVVRSLAQRFVFDARRAAFGVSVSYGGRSGPTYTVYLVEAGRRADIGEYGSRRVLVAHRDLTETFLEAAAAGEAYRSPARDSTSREMETWMAQEDAAKATVDAYYQSPAWRRLPLIIGVGLALYLLIMGGIMIASERH